MPQQPSPQDLRDNLGNMINTSPVGAPGQALLGLNNWFREVMPRSMGQGLDGVEDALGRALRELMYQRKRATWIDDGLRGAKDVGAAGLRKAHDATEDLTHMLWRLFNR